MISKMGGLNLLGRNAKSVFWGGYVDLFTLSFGKVDKYTAESLAFEDFFLSIFSLFIWIVHTALLPITIPIISLVKTLVDFFTRESLPVEQVSQFNSKFEAINNEELGILVPSILKYHAHSHSSARLLEELRKTWDEADDAYSQGNEAKQKSLGSARIAVNMELAKKEHSSLLNTESFKLKIIPSTQLTKEDLANLATYKSQNRTHCLQQRDPQLRSLIKNYVADEKNEGKKLQQLIVHSVFAPKKELPVEKEVKEKPITPLAI